MNKTNDFKYNLPAYSDPVDIEDLNDNFRGIDDALMAGLCKKDYTGNNMGSADPSARKYAWAPWLEIVNDNEFDVVVTDRNAPAGSEEATINIAAGQSFRKYINGRYYMNFYVQDQYDVTFKWFTNAETYINESGGGGGGTGTVTSVSVQGGSGSHLTGSGNPIETSGTITINVDEGYSIPSDNEQTAWDGKAADLKAEIDSSTYVLTLQLKDSSGNLIGNERTIDLPLETMVVDGEYDPQTKKIKLELKNGNYVEFSVADLVSGLQTELSASNKLDPAFIAYDSTHAAVTEAEKTTYAGKQNALTFDDAPTSGSNNPVKSGGVYTALSGKQDSLSSSQLAAVNSGIDSAKVGQISTNQANILYNLNMGVKNELDNFGTKSYESSGVTFTFNEDGSVHIKGTATGANAAFYYYTGGYSYISNIYKGHILSGVTGGAEGTYGLLAQYSSNGTSWATQEMCKTAPITIKSDYNYINICIIVFSGQTVDTTIYPMLCTPEAWAQSHDFMPPALPNHALTRLESEDRAALAEEIDAGAKNLADWRNTTPVGTDVTISDGTYTSNNSDSRTTLRFQAYAVDSSDATIAFFNGNGIEPTSNGVINIPFTLPSGTAKIKAGHNGGQKNARFNIPISTLEVGKSYVLQVNVTQYTNPSGIFQWKDFMICTLADWKVSQKFAAYKPTSQILVASKTNFTTSTGTTLQDTGVSYTIPSDGIYRITASLTYGTGMPTEISIVNSANEGMIYDRAVPPTGMNVMGLTAQTLIAASSGAVKVRAKFEIANASAPISLIVEKIG